MSTPFLNYLKVLSIPFDAAPADAGSTANVLLLTEVLVTHHLLMQAACYHRGQDILC